MKKIIIGLVAVFSLSLASIASAHSTVTPSTSSPSKYETFSLSVPTEKDVPTIGIHLLVPDKLDRVTPFVKPGWNIKVTKNDAGNATQIEWTGNSIPAGQKDIFQFTARTAPEPATLIWKVYQTYQGGEVVAWDQDPHQGTTTTGGEIKNPYSITEITATTAPVTDKKHVSDARASLGLSLAALIFSLLALRLSLKPRQP